MANIPELERYLTLKDLAREIGGFLPFSGMHVRRMVNWNFALTPMRRRGTLLKLGGELGTHVTGSHRLP